MLILRFKQAFAEVNMDYSYYIDKRQKLSDKLPNGSFAVMCSGLTKTASNDQNYDFEVDRNFYYFTGVDFPSVKFVTVKAEAGTQNILFVPRRDPHKEKWTGKILSVEEYTLISGIKEVLFSDEYDDYIYKLVNSGKFNKCFLFANNTPKGKPKSEHNLICADIARRFPFLSINDLSQLVYPLRAVKDAEETALIKKAASLTNTAISEMAKMIKPGLKEYEPQAVFEYVVQRNGGKPAFRTIAASGENAITLHYMSNRDTMKDSELLLVDCGASIDWYNSDVSRTFPVSGKFTQRQLELYKIVLNANKLIINSVRPGISMNELNDILKDYYVKELTDIGLIQDASEVDNFYYHSVSHSLGLDTHDPLDRSIPLQEGNVITVEPGLYIEKYNMGIRIEDDVLVTAKGCEVLTDVIKEPEEIEELMNVWELK